MKSTLQYIDDVLEREADNRAANNNLPDGERASIRKQALTAVAGFKVFDEAKERDLLDAVAKKRIEGINLFRTERSALRHKLSGLGITPLAIVPREAWNRICVKAKLYRFKPDSNNRVRISPTAFNGLDETRKLSRETVVTNFAQAQREAFLDRLFPNYQEVPDADRRHIYGERNHYVTLILPPPPPDVVDTLLKAKSLALHTAAVGEAISFVETPAEMLRERVRLDEQERQYQEWLKNDPIVYHEGDHATAIIAQFGDFPVEKEVVDFVAGSDDIFPDKMPAETISVLRAGNDMADAMWLAARQSLLGQMQTANAFNRSGLMGLGL